eukprot:scaffold25470_cov25-Tisochrysis_lutea.AAC.1
MSRTLHPRAPALPCPILSLALTTAAFLVTQVWRYVSCHQCVVACVSARAQGEGWRENTDRAT